MSFRIEKYRLLHRKGYLFAPGPRGFQWNISVLMTAVFSRKILLSFKPNQTLTRVSYSKKGSLILSIELVISNHVCTYFLRWDDSKTFRRNCGDENLAQNYKMNMQTG